MEAIPASVDVRPVVDSDEVEQALELRKEVFCGEQGVDLSAERDGRDGEALHLVAVEDGAVVGTCRLVFDGDLALLGRLVVARELRRRGIASSLLREATRRSAENGARRISLHAQLSARALYVEDGYAECGEPFVEEGIDHVAMEKAIA